MEYATIGSVINAFMEVKRRSFFEMSYTELEIISTKLRGSTHNQILVVGLFRWQ